MKIQNLKLKVVALMVSVVMVFGCLIGCSSQEKYVTSTSDYSLSLSSAKTYTVDEIPAVIKAIDFGEGIEIEGVQAIFVSEEYIEEKFFNSISNFYLGYMAEELVELDGEAWFFSISADGETSINTVNRERMLAEYEASLLTPKQNNTLRNFLIGGGVILLTATLSVFGTPAVACIALGALKGAVVGATLGSAVYAAGSAISYRVSEGTWQGSGEVILESSSEGFLIGSIVGAATGAISATNCFVEDTPVLIEGGASVAIQNIEVGMKVACANPENPYITDYSVVTETFSREVYETYIVDCGDFKIETTAEHPFYVVEAGWVDAEQLSFGDRLITAFGEVITIESVMCYNRDTPLTVYNFEVENLHTYYVGSQEEDDFVLVHNSCLHTQKAWSDERTLHWKQSGEFYQQNYATFKNQVSQSGKYLVTESNIQRMLTGKAPLDLTGKSVQLHHTSGIMNDLYSYIELTSAEHYANFKALHYWLYK